MERFVPRHKLPRPGRGWFVGAVCLSLGLLAVGCVDPKERFQAAETAMDTENLPALRELEARVEKARQAALAKPALKPAAGWSGPPLVADNGAEKGGNAVVMLLNAGLCEDAFPKGELFRFCGANQFCTQRMTVNRTANVDFERTSKDELDRILERMRVGWKNALALRYAAFVEPVKAQTYRAHGDTFTPGIYVAKVRVYDLEGTKYLGGFELKAGSDNTVGIGRNTGTRSALARDFRDNTAKALSDGLSSFSGNPTRLDIGDTLEWD